MSGRTRLNGKRRGECVSAKELDKLMNILLALDRTLVEFSILIYNVPHCHRFALREQNRLLHAALKKHLSFVSEP